MSDALMKATSRPSDLTIKLSYILQLLLMLEFTGQKKKKTRLKFGPYCQWKRAQPAFISG